MIVEKIQKLVNAQFDTLEGSHDWFHIERVLKMSLHIQSETFTEQVLILDLSGKLVMKSTSNVLNVESLQKGSYMVRVFTNGRVINQPVYIR